MNRIYLTKTFIYKSIRTNTVKCENGWPTVTQLRYGHAKSAHTSEAESRSKAAIQDVKSMPVFDYAGPNPKAKRMVYLSGLAATGALGDPRFITPKPLTRELQKNTPDPFDLALRIPKKPHLSPFAAHPNTKVVHVSCGYGFTLFAARCSDTSHTLFGCGLNNESQIGYHTAGKMYKRLYRGDRTHPFKPLILLANVVPIPMPLKTNQAADKQAKVVKVAAGRVHSLVLNDLGEVYTFGCNTQGQCARPLPPLKSPEDMKPGENEHIEESLQVKARPHLVRAIPEKVVDILAGCDHSLFLTESGQVYSCGWGADGQTGLGHVDSVFEPSLVQGDIKNEKIVQLSCFADSVLALNDKGEVFGWGNTEYSQLHINSESQGENNVQQVSVPRQLKLPREVGKVTHVAAGGSGCALVNSNGNAFIWGFGILGMGPAVDHLRVPTMLKEPLFGANEFSPDVRVKEIYAGQGCYAAINTIGDVYVWGKNRHGILGLGIDYDQYFPYRVSLPLKITDVSIGIDHMAMTGSFLI